MEYWREDLYHHGIRGQKWGVRNGPPYPLRPGAHSRSEEKAGWRKSLNNIREKAKQIKKEADEQQIRDLNTLSAKEYKKIYQSSQKRDKKKLEKYGSLSRWDTLTDKQKKAIIAAGLITVGALTVGYAYRQYGIAGANYIDDVIIKSGTTLQTLSGDPNRVALGEHFYTAYLDRDKRTYLGNFSNLNRNELKSKILTNVINDMKVASPKTVENELKTFIKDLSKTDEGTKILRDYVENNAYSIFGKAKMPVGMVDANVKMMLEDKDFGWTHYTRQYIRNLNFAYEGSSQYDEESMPFIKAFYSHLKDKGYSALKDSNDMGWTMEPTIVFDRTKLGESVVNEITNKEISMAAAKEFLEDVTMPRSVINLIDQGGTSVAAITGLGVLGTAEYNVHQKKKQQSGGS